MLWQEPACRRSASRPRPLLQEQGTSGPDFHELVFGQAL